MDIIHFQQVGGVGADEIANENILLQNVIGGITSQTNSCLTGDVEFAFPLEGSQLTQDY